MGVNIAIVGSLAEGGSPRHPDWDSARLAGDKELADALGSFEGEREYATYPEDDFGPGGHTGDWRPVDFTALTNHLQALDHLNPRAMALIECLQTGNWFISVVR